MRESAWIRRIGPGIATIGALTFVTASTIGASERSWTPPPCAGPPGDAAGPATDGAGAWYREDPVMVDGTLRGLRLTLGLADAAPPRVLELDAEAFASGPYGARVLVGTDDGRTSHLSLVDVEAVCAWPIATSRDVIRRATLAPDGRTVYEMRVDRTTRADRGIWRRPLDGRQEPVRVMAPLAVDDRFGRTFTTAFTWSADDSRLAVRSCGEVACRVRVLDPATGRLRLLDDPSLGDVIGLTRERVVAHAACRGLPCPIVSVSLRTGIPIVLEPAAGLATMIVLPDGAIRVVMETGEGGRALRSSSIDGHTRTVLERAPTGRRLVPSDGRSGSAVALPPGWLAFGTDARLPFEGASQATLRDVVSGRTVDLGEVPR
jgi:hypothetical protein